MNSNELAHWGVKGMRWGHRKRQDTVSTNTTNRPNSNGGRKNGLSRSGKTALRIGAATVGSALAVYGTYKLSQLAYKRGADRALTNGLSALAIGKTVDMDGAGQKAARTVKAIGYTAVAAGLAAFGTMEVSRLRRESQAKSRSKK